MTAKAVRIKIKVGKHPTAAPGVDYTPPRIPWRRAENARQRTMLIVGATFAIGAVIGLSALLVNDDDADPSTELANSELTSPPPPAEALPTQQAQDIASINQGTARSSTSMAEGPSPADVAQANTEIDQASTAAQPSRVVTAPPPSTPTSGAPAQITSTVEQSARTDAVPVKEKISSKNIVRTQLATRREGLEPANSVDNKVQARDRGAVRVYYFNELHGLKGRTVTHQWIHNGKVYANVEAEVKGNAWRMYSSKALNSTMTGEWKINVTDEQGNTLATRSFSYEK